MGGRQLPAACQVPLSSLGNFSQLELKSDRISRRETSTPLIYTIQLKWLANRYQSLSELAISRTPSRHQRRRWSRTSSCSRPSSELSKTHIYPRKLPRSSRNRLTALMLSQPGRGLTKTSPASSRLSSASMPPTSSSAIMAATNPRNWLTKPRGGSRKTRQRSP